MAAAEIPPWISAKVRPGGEPVVLVLDDVHLLAGSDSLAFVSEDLGYVAVNRSGDGNDMLRSDNCVS